MLFRINKINTAIAHIHVQAETPEEAFRLAREDKGIWMGTEKQEQYTIPESIQEKVKD